MKKIKVISAVLTVLLLVSAFTPAMALPVPELSLSAKAYAVYNLDLDCPVYSVSENETRKPASLVKMMTALVAYDMSGGKLKETMVTVPENIWSHFVGFGNISVCGLVPGESMSLYDILNGLLVASGNEAATTIALHFGYDGFMEAMNAKAAELGMNNTHFVNPHGLDNDKQYTTAADIMLLTRAFVKVPELYEISRRVTYQLPATAKSPSRTVYTTNNAMILSSADYYSPLRGVKTGTTPGAGQCLASTAVYGGNTYLVVVMGSSYGKAFSDSEALYRWAFVNLRIKSPIDRNTVVAQVKVTGSNKKDTLVLYPDRELLSLFGSDEAVEVTYECDLPQSVAAPVKSGDLLGTARVFYNGQEAGEVNLMAREDVSQNLLVVLMEFIGSALSSPLGIAICCLLVAVILIYIYLVKVVFPKRDKRRQARKTGR